MGVKSAALAVAAGAGLPVLPGLVVTTDAMSRHDEGDEEVSTELKSWFDRARGDERHTLIVRSSSHSEDRGESMAGRFETIAGVESPEDLLDALHEVLESRAKAAEGVDWLSRSRRTRIALVSAAVMLAIAVALSRVVLGVHWFSDVAAGLFLGWVWVAVSYRMERRLGTDRASGTGATA